jgi:hypothetical protein
LTSAFWVLTTRPPMGNPWFSTTNISLLPLPRRVSPTSAPF